MLIRVACKGNVYANPQSKRYQTKKETKKAVDILLLPAPPS